MWHTLHEYKFPCFIGEKLSLVIFFSKLWTRVLEESSGEKMSDSKQNDDILRESKNNEKVYY